MKDVRVRSGACTGTRACLYKCIGGVIILTLVISGLVYYFSGSGDTCETVGVRVLDDHLADDITSESRFKVKLKEKRGSFDKISYHKEKQSIEMADLTLRNYNFALSPTVHDNKNHWM